MDQEQLDELDDLRKRIVQLLHDRDTDHAVERALRGHIKDLTDRIHYMRETHAAEIAERIKVGANALDHISVVEMEKQGLTERITALEAALHGQDQKCS